MLTLRLMSRRSLVSLPDQLPRLDTPESKRSSRTWRSTLRICLRRRISSGLAWVEGTALAVHAADDYVNDALLNSPFADKFFKPGAVLGQLGTLLGTATTVYIIGRTKDQPKVSHVGMDLIQSLLISETLTQSLKHITRRERPDGSGATSFPSGHAADTFAFATALERHLGWKGAVPAYIFASYVAISRLPANRHWLSDAVFGATVGIIAGRTVTRHGSEFPVAIGIEDGGVSATFSHTWK